MMKKTRLLTILVAFLAISIFVSAYILHPFTIAKGIVAAPDNQSLTITRNSYDMVAGHEPEFIEIRNQHKATIAYTQTATHVGIFCPSIQFCWAFPYSGEIVEPMRLDYKSLDYNTISTTGTPSWNHKPYHFSKGPGWIKLLSPLIIINDNFFAFLMLAVLYFLPILLASWYIPFASNSKTPVKWLLLIPGGTVFIIYTGLLVIGTLWVFLLEFGLPSLYCLAIIAISVFSANYASKNFRIKPIANAFEKLDTDD